MLKSALPDVNEWLTNNGFNRVTEETRKFVYEGILQCNHVEVPIRYSFDDLSFQKLPEIHLVEPRPTALCRPLPHVDCNNKLCYLDEEAYRSDPYHPVQTIVNCLGQAKNVLFDSLSGKNSADVGYEFNAYWECVSRGIILSRHQSGDITKYNYITYISPTGKNRSHIVMGNDKEIVQYQTWRNAKLALSENRNAIWIDITKSALLPDEGKWPPQSFKMFFEWLTWVDLKAAKTLKKILASKAGAQSRLLIIVNTMGGFVGIEVISQNNFTQNPGRFCKQLLIDKGISGVKIKRICIDDFSPKFITTRNLQGSDLSSKKIVLIGCGTIGGYLSRLLIQSGAGQGSGELKLYDGQLLTSGNIGRHYLDSNYLYENKAIACQHKLQSEFHFATIKAKPDDFISISDVKNSDLVIDATGREPFSLSLNNQVANLHNKNKLCPDILYVWIDGNGFCGRTFYYNGVGGCYRCLQCLSGKDRFPPLKSEDDLIPMKYKCGESFVPYPPSISVQAAGMGLEMILEWVNGNVKHQFRNRNFNDKARKHKEQNLTPITDCPACQS